MADAASEPTPAKAPEETTPAAAPVDDSTPSKPAEETPAESAPAETAKEEAAPAETAPEAPPKDDEVAPAAPPKDTPAEAAEEPKKAQTSAPAEAPAEKSEAARKSPPNALTRLFAELDAIKKEADYGEMWGVKLSDESHVPSTIVLEKFLRANNKDVAKAKSQLTSALKWRKRVQPAKLLEETEFDPVKFGGLGYVTIYPKSDKHEKEILTWNIYGATKNLKTTFGNVEEFINWRAALMELSVKELDLPSATEKIPENGADPYRMVQVHDYLNISFFRMDSSVKAASKETIEVFSMAYPELLKEKFFVNVPLVMGWVFAAMKIFLSPDTIKKFHPLSYGGSLAGELKSYGQELPPAYGGKGKDIKEGLTVKYAAVEVQDTAPVATEAPAKAEDSKEASAETADKKDTPAETANKEDAPAEVEEKEKAPAETEEKKEAPDATEDNKDAPAEEEDKKDTPAETGEKKDVPTEAAEKSTAVEATA